MALQHGVDRLQLLDYIDFQSPLTGQWPCNSGAITPKTYTIEHFQSPLTGQWPCNSVVTEPYWGLYILSVPSNGAMALQLLDQLLWSVDNQDFQSPLTGQWPCNKRAIERLLQHCAFQSPLTGQWPCNHYDSPESIATPLLSVPSNGAMALQPLREVLCACHVVDFQSPLTGQWPCNI